MPATCFPVAPHCPATSSLTPTRHLLPCLQAGLLPSLLPSLAGAARMRELYNLTSPTLALLLVSMLPIGRVASMLPIGFGSHGLLCPPTTLCMLRRGPPSTVLHPRSTLSTLCPLHS